MNLLVARVVNKFLLVYEVQVSATCSQQSLLIIVRQI
jgi:hypothetical protein